MKNVNIGSIDNIINTNKGVARFVSEITSRLLISIPFILFLLDNC